MCERNTRVAESRVEARKRERMHQRTKSLKILVIHVFFVSSLFGPQRPSVLYFYSPTLLKRGLFIFEILSLSWTSTRSFTHRTNSRARCVLSLSLLLHWFLIRRVFLPNFIDHVLLWFDWVCEFVALCFLGWNLWARFCILEVILLNWIIRWYILLASSCRLRKHWLNLKAFNVEVVILAFCIILVILCRKFTCRR